jgi:hypothetical protein
VARDVAEEFISRASARADYGVVFHDDLTVDAVATAALRNAMAARREVSP